MAKKLKANTQVQTIPLLHKHISQKTGTCQQCMQTWDSPQFPISPVSKSQISIKITFSLPLEAPGQSLVCVMIILPKKNFQKRKKISVHLWFTLFQHMTLKILPHHTLHLIQPNHLKNINTHTLMLCQYDMVNNCIHSCKIIP